MNRVLIILLSLLVLNSCSDFADNECQPVDIAWHEDILGDGFEARSVPLEDSFDGSVCCTVVRRLSRSDVKRAVLYVHGYNDYFFQSEMGKRFCDSLFNFYAVDLRRYGRSIRSWQRPFEIRDMRDYFEDLDSALNIIRGDGNTDITLVGHSTGGLTTSLYVALQGEECRVDRLITDSPFLEWNFSLFMREALIPVVGLIGKVFPNIEISQNKCAGYAYSLLKNHHGEWHYNTNWKSVYSPPVTSGWINAISVAQQMLMRHSADITVPVLVMHSNRKVEGCTWTPEFQHGDAVLDPDMIANCGAKLGKNPQIVSIQNGLHNLVLSSYDAREYAYETMFDFIRKTML